MNFRFLSRLLWSRGKVVIWAVLLVVIVAGFCFMNRAAIQEYLDSYHKRNSLKSEVDRLESERKALEQQRDYLAVGGFEIEKEARERLRLSRPGEKVLYLDAEESPDTAGLATSATLGATPTLNALGSTMTLGSKSSTSATLAASRIETTETMGADKAVNGKMNPKKRSGATDRQ